MYSGAGILFFHRSSGGFEVLLALRAGRALGWRAAVAARRPRDGFFKACFTGTVDWYNKGQWSVLGGKVHRGESFAVAAAREVTEEASLPPGVSLEKLLAALVRYQPKRFSWGFWAWRTFFVELNEKPPLSTWPSRRADDSDEWQECRWVPANALPDPLHRLMPATVKALRERLA